MAKKNAKYYVLLDNAVVASGLKWSELSAVIEGYRDGLAKKGFKNRAVKDDEPLIDADCNGFGAMSLNFEHPKLGLVEMEVLREDWYARLHLSV
jgi:hypothetical protein